VKKLAALVLAIAPYFADAVMQKEIDGYLAVKFGMTRAEAEKALGAPFTSCEAGETGPHESCFTAKAAEITGVPVTFNLWFLDGRLIKVGVVFVMEGGPAGRIAKYDELGRLLESKYGKCDQVDRDGISEEALERQGRAWAMHWWGPGRETAIALVLQSHGSESGLRPRVEYYDATRMREWWARKKAAEAQAERLEAERRQAKLKKEADKL